MNSAVPVRSEDGGAAPRPPGKLLDIGGYRLHLYATGEGSPTVVLISGAGDYSFVWSRVQPEVSRFARVCSYDRAGDAWSDPGPVPRSMRQEAHELRLLLCKAELPPPYVLVGHSLGGLIARLYATTYPGEVAGTVLVDSTHENTILGVGRMENGNYVGKLVRMREEAGARAIPPPQTMKSSPPPPPTEEDRKGWEEFRERVGPLKIKPPFDRLPPETQKLQLWAQASKQPAGASEDHFAEELQALYEERQRVKHPLGDMPLTSLRAGGSFVPEQSLLDAIHMTPEEWLKEKERNAEEIATLSSNGKWYVAKSSGHHIHLEDPELVVFAVRRVVESARQRGRTKAP